MKLATIIVRNMTEKQRAELIKMRGTQVMFLETDYIKEDDRLVEVEYYLVQKHQYMWVDLDTCGIDWEVLGTHLIKDKRVSK